MSNRKSNNHIRLERMKGIAGQLIKLLKEETDRQIVIHRLDSETTNSIYLKLDYGLAGTVRISDHLPKKKYSYTYNILVKKGNISCDGLYNCIMIDDNKYGRAVADYIPDILSNRNSTIIGKGGYGKYKNLMDEERRDSLRPIPENFFWSRSRRV